jgi:GTPase involved in cell partitioning and DNA repair
LGHLILLKDMIENNKKKQKLKVIEKELNQKLIEKRKIITKTRLDKRRQEELLHHKRRIEHEARLKKLQIKSKKEMDEKRRRQLEFKLWMATGGK